MPADLGVIEAAGPRLSRSINSFQYFAVGFGCVVGVGWVVVLGSIIGMAGPGGAALALGVGGLIVLLVAFCYAEMAAVRPAAGGELVYGYELGGAGVSYGVGWTVALLYVTACAFEAISTGAVVDMLFPGIQGPLLYSLFGQEVRLGSVLMGIAGALALWALNRRGANMSAKAQEWITYVRIALILGFLVVAFVYAKPENLAPLFDKGASASKTGAFIAALATAPFWFGGFTVFATAAEESTSSMKLVGRAVVFSVVGATAFYVLLALGVAAMVPWRDLAGMQLPAAQAFEAAMGSPVVAKVVLITALLGNFTAWNSLLLAGSRVLFAMGRARLLSPAFGQVHPRFHTPAAAVAFVSAVSIAAIFLGKGFILPLVNMTSACFALTYIVTCASVIKLRGTEPGTVRDYRIPGGHATAWIALVASVGLLILALAQPYLAAKGGFPVEWTAILVWSALGLVLWQAARGGRVTLTEAERTVRLRGALTGQVAPPRGELSPPGSA